MNAASLSSSLARTPADRSVAEPFQRYVVKVGGTTCSMRVRTIAAIAEVLGFEQEMEGTLSDPPAAAEDSVVVDLLDSRMIAPPRPVRRRQRPVSSRAVFYGIGG